MATQLQHRRGSTAENNSFPGAEGELTVDLEKNVLVVHNNGPHPQVNAATLLSSQAGKGASLVGINDAGGLYAATTVEAALQEVKNATNIVNTPAGGIASINVQAALNELDTEKMRIDTLAASTGAGLIGNTPTGTIAATTVQGAINEIVSDLSASTGSARVGYLPAGTGASTDRSVQDKLREIISRSDYNSDINFNNAAAGKISINAANTLSAPRFEGTATDDGGTPDGVFRVNRTHVTAASPHSFRDQTIFSPTANNIAACSFDAQLVSSGTANQDHTIGFQARNNYNSSGTLTNMYGFGSYPVVSSGTVTNCIGLEIKPHSGSGTVTNEYGIYIHNQVAAATNKYPLYIASNLGSNLIGAATNFAGQGIVSIGGNARLYLGDSGNNFKSIAYNHNMNDNTAQNTDRIQSIYFGPQDFVFRADIGGVAGRTPTLNTVLNIRTDNTNANYGAVFPGANGTQNLGISGQGWKEIFASNGTINVSDARVKTEVRDFTENELSASKQLAKEIGIFKFLSAISEKGDSARNHIGMTVQRAIEVMESYNLDAMAYGFICYDEWEDEYEEHPAIYHKITNEFGDVVDGDIKDAAWTEHKRKAGNTYGFRVDQLLLFISKGYEKRLADIENSLNLSNI
jgi:hypothetical protein